MTYEWRIAGSRRGWGRITLPDEHGARAYLEHEYPGTTIELRPYQSRGRPGRPPRWRKLDAATERIAIRLTPEDRAWLESQPGETLSDKVRHVFARARDKEQDG